MHKAVLSLGSNQGNRMENLHAGIALLQNPACRILVQSSVYLTDPWGNTEQPSFYNMVVGIETEMQPPALLDTLLAIEQKAGRVRDKKWEPRTLDIDILFFENRVLDIPGLTVPHPRLLERRFVLEPLFEIFPDFIHPVLGKSIRTLLAEVQDAGGVEKLSVTGRD